MRSATHTRQNLTIQQEDRPLSLQPCPGGQEGGLHSPSRTKLTPSSPAPVPDKRGLVVARAPCTFGGAVGSGLGGNKARREVSRAPAAPTVRDGGSEASTRGNRGPGKGPFHPGIPGVPRRPYTVGFQVLGPAHSPLLTSRRLSPRLHHKPSCRSRHGPKHFPLCCLSRGRNLRLSWPPAKQIRHFRPRAAPSLRPGFSRIG